MIRYKTTQEIEIMREAAQIVSRTLGLVAKHMKPGVTPRFLDQLAEDYILTQNAVPGFKGLYGCPSTLLTSVNEAVVHGLPNKNPLKDGDIVSVDCGVLMNGFYGDSAFTFEVGEVTVEVKELLNATKQCLYLGIEAAIVGNRTGDIGFAVQNYAESQGYGVVRELVGHGLGRSLHEGPEVPNFGKAGKGKQLKKGMTIAGMIPLLMELTDYQYTDIQELIDNTSDDVWNAWLVEKCGVKNIA